MVDPEARAPCQFVEAGGFNRRTASFDQCLNILEGRGLRREIDRCRTEDQIKADLVAQYGPRVLALPAAHGFSVAAYLVPVVAALLVVAGLAALLRRRRVPEAVTRSRTPAAADVARLESELERYR